MVLRSLLMRSLILSPICVLAAEPSPIPPRAPLMPPPSQLQVWIRFMPSSALKLNRHSRGLLEALGTQSRVVPSGYRTSQPNPFDPPEPLRHLMNWEFPDFA